MQSLIAMGTGGLTGVGLGAGRAKWHFLPNAHTDFIFAVIGEELGLIGSLLVLSLFFAFAVLGVRVAARAPDRFGMLLAAGITVWVTAQAAINIGGVVGLLPVSGIPLPFVSFGGSSLVFTMVGAGILANIARQSRHVAMSAEHDGPRARSRSSPVVAPAATCIPRSRSPTSSCGVAIPAAPSTSSARARGLEARVVPAAGYSIDLLPGRGLQRSLRPRAVLDNVAALWATVRAFGQAWRIVGSRRPEVVIGVGGYASMPCVLAARLRRVPVVVHEQNAAPGLANRVAVRLGARAAISLPGTPLRDAVAHRQPDPGRDRRACARRRTGRARSSARSAAASARGRVNDAVLDLAGRWRPRTDVAVRHVSGVRDHDRCAGVLQSVRTPGDALDYELVAYEEHMEELYVHARVAVCRAGAVTVAELTAAGLPAVLVPLPGAPGDHQNRNADALVAAGAAVTIPDAQLDGARLAATLDDLLAAPGKLSAMRDAARSLARVDAAARVADLVEGAARGRP